MTEKVIKRRNVHPAVAQARSAIAVAAHQKRPDHEIQALRAQLAEARIIEAAEKVAASLPEVSEEAKARIAALLGGAL